MKIICESAGCKELGKYKAQIEKENHSTEISGAIEIKEVENEDPIDNQVIAQVENESKIYSNNNFKFYKWLWPITINKHE